MSEVVEHESSNLKPMKMKEEKKGEDVVSPRSKQVGTIKLKGDKVGTGPSSPKGMISPRRPKQKNEEKH